MKEQEWVRQRLDLRAVHVHGPDVVPGDLADGKDLLARDIIVRHCSHIKVLHIVGQCSLDDLAHLSGFDVGVAVDNVSDECQLLAVPVGALEFVFESCDDVEVDLLIRSKRKQRQGLVAPAQAGTAVAIGALGR
jgi:hypothetical protein